VWHATTATFACSHFVNCGVYILLGTWISANQLAKHGVAVEVASATWQHVLGKHFDHGIAAASVGHSKDQSACKVKVLATK
jgi:hypothetical protein